MSILAVLTADRSQTLLNCLATVFQTTSTMERLDRLLVIDNSADDNAIIEASRGIASFVGEYYAPIDYQTTVDWRTELDKRAVHHEKRALQEEPFSFSTDTVSVPPGITSAGAARNTAQLRSAGHKLVSFDDDIRVVFSKLQPVDDHSRTASLPTAETLHCETKEFGASIISGYFAASDELDQLTEYDPTNVLDQMFASLEGPCNAVMTGVRGNRWFDRPSQFYHLDGPLRDKVYGTKKTYRAARLGPYAVSQVPYRLTTDAPFFLTGCSGYDNRKLMPPFPPLGRSQDTVFGLLTRYMYPDSVTTHLPYCVHHDLVPPQPVTEEQFVANTNSYGFLTYLVVRLLVHRSQSEITETAETQLTNMGSRLRGIVAVRTEDWWDNLHELAIQYATQQVSHLERLLERYDERPSWWARDVYRFIDDLVLHAGERSSAVPRELRATVESEAAIEHHRAFCQRYGELLERWPEIWNRAAERNSNR